MTDRHMSDVKAVCARIEGCGMPRPNASPSGIMPEPGRPIEVRHVEAAIKAVAYAVVAHGEVYGPILDRLEAELAEMQRRRRPADRARAILDAYTVDGGVKAIGGLDG